METVKSKKIELKIEGLADDDGAVRLSVFNDKVDQLVKILADAERQAAHVRQAKSNFRIVELEYSSAFMGVEPFQLGEYTGSIQAVSFLEDVIHAIDSEADSLGNVKSSLVKKIQDLCSGDGDKFDAQILGIGGIKVRTNHDLAKKAQKYLDRKYTCHSEIKGFLGRVNVHNRNEFFIYTDQGERAISCRFDPDTLLDKVKSAIGKTVIIEGTMSFIGSDIEPVDAFVISIEEIPEDYVTPNSVDFLGKSPGLTGEMDTLEFVRTVRDEWKRY